MRRSWASLTVGVLVVIVAGLSYWLIRSTSDRTHDQGYAVWALFQQCRRTVREVAGGDRRHLRRPDRKTRARQGTAKAKITIRIAPDIVLYENAIVAKKSASLLGEYFLEIDPGTPRKEVDGQAQGDAEAQGR